MAIAEDLVPLDVARGLAHLLTVDPDMAAVVARVGTPKQIRRPPGFAALVNIIVSQQVSVQSAAAIWNRLVRTGPVTPVTVLGLAEDGLCEVGFSRPKIRYTLALAHAIQSGSFDPKDLEGLADDDAMAMITSLLGFGRWSGEIYLMFCLSRSDIWPAGDIALQEAVRGVKYLTKRPGLKEMDEIAVSWRPWRSVAARLLWRYYRDVTKGRTNEGMIGIQ